MSNKTKRLEIFRFCAPLAPKTPGQNEELYLCPICGKGYPEEAANNGELTLEHVPPESMGGKGLLLTCRDCNSQAGNKIDSHIDQQIVLDSFYRTLIENNHQDSEEISGDLLIIDERFNVQIRQKDNHIKIEVIGKANNPNKVNELKNFFASGSTNDSLDGFEFKIQKKVKLDHRLRRVALLKSGFLLITAMLGYKYAFDERLSVVREQILNPENDLLGSSFCVTANENQPFPKNCIISVSNPFPLFLVIFDEEAIILPNLSSPKNLYEIVKAESVQKKSTSITGEKYEWPKKPLMILDIQS